MRAYLRVIVSAAVAVPLFALAACDETVDATKVVAVDAGTDSGSTTTPSLYDRLGGKPGIAKLVDAIVKAEVMDPEIASYFAPNAANPPPAGKPTVAQIEGCLVLQISAALDPTKATYPGKTDDGFSCRDMHTAHMALHIGNGTFDKFAAIATQVATAAASQPGSNLGPDDLKLVGTFLTAQKPLIVDPTAPDGGFFGAATTDSGAGTDASDAATAADAPDGD